VRQLVAGVLERLRVVEPERLPQFDQRLAGPAGQPRGERLVVQRRDVA